MRQQSDETKLLERGVFRYEEQANIRTAERGNGSLEKTDGNSREVLSNRVRRKDKNQMF